MKLRHLIGVMNSCERMMVYDPVGPIAGGMAADVYRDEDLADREVLLILPKKDLLVVAVGNREGEWK